jgi:hypothetical protein
MSVYENGIHSFDSDGHDNGGREPSPNVKSTDQTCSNITFILEP